MAQRNPLGLYMQNEIIRPIPVEQYKIYDPNHLPHGGKEAGVSFKKESSTGKRDVHKKHYKKMQLKKHKMHKKANNNFTPLAFLSRLSVDDLIIIGLIILLILESEDEPDIPLVIALGFLFISEFLQE